MQFRKLFVLSAALMMIAGGASAQQTTLKMGGAWYSHRGPLIDIPLNGGPAFQSPCFLQTGCLENFRQRNGGIPAPLTVGGLADVVVTTNGSAPATFNIPGAAFGQNSAMAPSTALVQIVPTVVQLQSTFAVLAPGDTATQATQILNFETQWIGSKITPTTPTGAVLTNVQTTIQGALAANRVLRQDAWMTQTGRLAPDFSFCPGGATGSEYMGNLAKVGGVVNCTTADPAQNLANGPYGAQYNGLVKYTAGPNRFGGTMMKLLDGGGFVSVIRRTTPASPQSPTTPFSGTTNVICHQPIGAAGAAGYRNQNTGAGYAFLTSAFLQSGPCNRGFVSGAGTTPGNDKIVSIGPELATGTNFSTFPTPGGGTIMVDQNVLPSDRNLNVGFPFTTGTVTVINTGTVANAPSTTTLTAMGSLNTSMGVGNITLVAGTISHRALANQDTSYMDVVRMSFTPEPGATLMLGASLLAIGGIYVSRRRR